MVAELVVVIILLIATFTLSLAITILAWRTGIYSHKSLRWYLKHIVGGCEGDGPDCD